MKLVYDVETDGLLHSLTLIDCLVLRDVAPEDPAERKTYAFARHPAGRYEKFDGTFVDLPERDDIEEGIRMMQDAEFVIGHNIMDFDERACHKVYPWYKSVREKVLDTMVLARVIMPDTGSIDDKLIVRGRLPGKLRKSHSLDAWGHRLGKHKGDYAKQCIERGWEPWKVWRPDKLDYCINDVDVTELLWESIAAQLPPPESVAFEHAIHDLTITMRQNGVPFAKAEAVKLAEKLDAKKNELIDSVTSKYGYWFTAEKKRIVAPLYEQDPDTVKDSMVPMIRARNAAVKKGQEFDASDYNQQTGYLRIRPEFGEDDSRSWWGEVKVAKKTRRAFDLREAYVKKCDEIEEYNARVTLFNETNPKKPKKFRNYPPKPATGFKFVQVAGGGLYCENPDTTEGSPYCPMIRKDFNPGSRHHVIDRLMTVHQWQPVDFTETGQPEVSDAVLQRLKDTIPETADLADIFFHKKLLGMLRDGEQAWLKAYDKANHPETGENCYALPYCIHGSINTGGTVSGRCSHFAPNLGQVPSVIVEALFDKKGLPDSRFLKDGVSFDALPDTGVPDEAWEDWPHLWNAEGKLKKKAHILGRKGEYGYECRKLFYTPRELFGIKWCQIGADLVNVEGRTLAGRMAQFDKGALLDFLVNGGDIHNYNMSLTGINDRSLIKRVFFALIYGAGDWKLGVTGDSKLSRNAAIRYGKELRALIMAKIPALKKLTDQVQAQAKRGFLIGVDGRHLVVRNDYAALNLQLQSDAGLIAKKWAVLAEEALLEAGGVHGWPTEERDADFVLMLFVHDELQFAIKEFFAEQGAEIICDAARKAGESFNYCAPIAADAKIGHDWAECH
jgi:DNA polymerase I-like protein with 3'-5' exonuclease and polymerase domains